MIKTFLLSGLTCLSLYAQSNLELKYHIDVNDEFKGALTFDSKESNAQVLYYNISERDKIPFYAAQKDFTLTGLQKEQTLGSLIVNEFRNTMKYDLSQLSTDQIEEAGVSQVDVPNSAIIYNKENLPTDVLEKRLIHTIESLILSIYTTTKVPKEPFYLYEPHKNMLMKVRFTNEGEESVEIDGKTCKTTVWLLGIENRDKKLIRLYANPYPVKIEASSKSWAFTIAGAGVSKEITVKKEDIAFSAFAKQIKKKYKNNRVEILGKKVIPHMFDARYETNFKVKQEISDEQIEEQVANYLKNERNRKTKTSETNAFVYALKEKTVIKAIEEALDTEEEATMYYKKGIQKYMAKDLVFAVAKEKKCDATPLRNEIMCGEKRDEKEEVDIEKEAEKTFEAEFAKKKAKFKIKEIKATEDGRAVVIKYEELVPLSDEMKVKYVNQAFKKEFENLSFMPTDYVYDKKQKTYFVYVDKNEVADYACTRIIDGLKAKFVKGICVAEATQVNNKKEVDSLVNDYLYSVYPDLKILNTPVKNDPDSFSFVYLGDLSKVTNGCK